MEVEGSLQRGERQKEKRRSREMQVFDKERGLSTFITKRGERKGVVTLQKVSGEESSYILT
ncbi:hypothetical protein HanHA300_Chr09g0308561 [Helianthus annuus]|nr:hypothetical protein HanHA300_Chr09g0308561 [Helianthus annuus]